MSNVENLADTIKPKSDQLNADDLLTGPINVLIRDVRRGSNDQPVLIDIEGLMPYKPCKTMRRVMVTAWGQNGKDWVGRSMTLYCDPSVKFGGVALGGIRISHLSHIDGPMNMMLTTSRGRKSEHVIHPLSVEEFPLDENAQSWIDAINAKTASLGDIEDPAYKKFIASKVME